MKLTELLNNIEYKSEAPIQEIDVNGLSYDSRKVKPGDLFVAMKGLQSDGSEFIERAVSNGASTVVLQKEIQTAVPSIIVSDTRDALWRLAQNFYGDPTQKLKLVGVTGTNGKTTTSFLTRSVLSQAGIKTALIGTLGYILEEDLLPLNHTTPEAPDVLELLSEAFDAGCKAAVMETSSHGLVQKRAEGCRFDIGVFTNLTQDHLDYHVTMEDYAQAKMRLFNDLAEKGGKKFTGIINLDDPYGEKFRAITCGETLTFGTNSKADCKASNIDVNVSSLSYDLETPWGSSNVTVPLGGRFNVDNSLAAASVCLALGVSLQDTVHHLSQASGVPGRFESIPTGRGFSVIVDYAHTPDALQKLLQTARELKPKRLVALFGCGGDRDNTKRPIMGKIASELADRCVVTSDNPRREDPDEIIKQVLNGIDRARNSNVEVQPDRRKAIELAVTTAQEGDLIMIAGKGHEDYQIIGETKYPFDDRKIVRETLSRL